MTQFLSEPLDRHDRSAFRSGNDRIDRYFQTGVTQDIRRRYVTCDVLVEATTGRLAGFHTLSAHSVGLGDLPSSLTKKLPRYPTVPAILLGWFGRDLAFRGQGVGELLLFDAIRKADTASVAAYAVIADPIDPAAAAFYRRFGFIELTNGRLFLTLASARDSLPR